MTETAHDSLDIPDRINGIKYFCQLDPEWSELPYTITQNPDQTIGTTGCVPALEAVVLFNLVRAVVNPPSMASWNLAHGFRTANHGTKRASWDLLVATNGLEQDSITPDVGAIRTALEVGGFVIASLKTPDRAGLGTPSGHIIGIHTVEADEKIRAIDTNSPTKSQLTWPLAGILPYASALRHIYVAS